MKSKILFFLCLLINSISIGQDNGSQHIADSLVKKLSVVKNDTVRAKILADLSYLYSNIDPDKGIEYGLEHLEIAKKFTKRPGELAYAYSNLGANYQIKSDFARALDYDLKALAIYEQIKSEENIASITNNIAVIYTALHEWAKALKYYSLALNMQRKRSDKAGMAIALTGLASVYQSLNDKVKALEYYAEARSLAEEIGERELVAVCFSNEGNVYQTDNNLLKAITYHFKALRINKEIGHLQNEAINLGNIGDVYLIVAKDTSGAKKYDSLISVSKAENLEKGHLYLSQAITLAREIGYIAFLSNCLAQISEIDELKGNYKEALQAHKEHLVLKDSIFSEDVKVRVANLETKREAELKEKQISINNLVVAQKRNQSIMYLAGLGILGLSVVGVYNRFKHQKKTAEMSHLALRQKEMLMKEIHHRVKNNLQVISSLLNMQIVNITDPLARDAMTESTNRLKAILLLHQQLYKDEQVGTIECAQFATDLFNQITAVFKRENQQIVLQNNIPPTVLDIDTAVSLGLILNELITNSYKYAFANENGSILLDITKTGANYTLTYIDSGPGLPAGLEVRALKSLGMKILNSLSRQLGGSMSYDKENKAFIINFKNLDERKRTE